MAVMLSSTVTNIIDTYISRLQDLHNRILDILDTLDKNDLTEQEANDSIIDLINEALPKTESESMSRHMIRRMLCAYNDYVYVLRKTYPSYILLLDGKHIVYFYNLKFGLVWDRIFKKYAKRAEDPDAFSHPPIYPQT